MINSCLSSIFYTKQRTADIAVQLLGKNLHFKKNNHSLVIQIVETEAYLGEQDKACHASKGKTKRNAVMYEQGACIYIYLIYGIYLMLNVVTQDQEEAHAVLIRAAQPIEGILQMQQNRKTTSINNLSNGPGKLTQALGITRQHNGHSLCTSTLFIENNNDMHPDNIVRTARIGINYAQEWQKKPLRFFIKNNPYVSHS